MISVAAETVLEFHLSLNVRDLERSVGFFGPLFACSPKKRHSDCGKFEPDELPLVLSLEPRRRDQMRQTTAAAQFAFLTEPA